MLKQHPLILLIFIGAVIVVLGSWYWVSKGTPPFRAFSSPTAATCQIYVIDESSRGDSRFFAINPTDKKGQLLGVLHKGIEFNALDVHPQTKVLYAIQKANGGLSMINSQTGASTLVGTTPFVKINSLAFHPHTGELWGWAEEKGIVRINPQTAESSVEFESLKKVDSLSWNDTGDKLYASIEDEAELYVYDPSSRTFTSAADNLPEGTESLNPLSGGHLLGASNEEDNELFLYIYDPVTKKVLASETITISGFELEGLAWHSSCGSPVQ